MRRKGVILVIKSLTVKKRDLNNHKREKGIFMKKKFVVNALFGLFIAVFLIGCTNNTQCNTYSSTYPPVQGKSKIAKNILEMRNNGLFDSFLILPPNELLTYQ